jgi:hypothetical protein
MQIEGQRFPFTKTNRSAGTANNFPYLPLTLSYQGISLSTSGLLDTGASGLLDTGADVCFFSSQKVFEVKPNTTTRL